VTDATFRVGIVGGSFLRKGIIYLLRALKLLNKPNVVLYMRSTEGNVTSHPEASRLCGELGVEFVPYLEDINEFYQSLDVFVLPSIDEGFGMVAYEALANGTPVIASSNVGSIDGLAPGKEILVVPAGDEQRLASALLRLYDDNDYRCSVGRAGRQFYEKKMVNGNCYAANLERLINNIDSMGN
jgi:glycosyltransferase involved in cell wall biosynthesis